MRSINSIFFGCLFCDRTKSTLQEDDATVFQSIDLLFRHISRHSHPLPHVPGVVVVYENRDANTRRRQDYDLSFPHSTMTTSPSGLPAYDPDRIASLPSARATKDHIRRRNEKPQPRPDSVSEVLQFLAGAKIVGVEFPEKWGGKWCQGWHDRVFGTFPSNIITFELPQHVEIASLPRTPRTGVSRWKFEKQRQPGWLALRKGETIYNLACKFSFISNLAWINTYISVRGGSIYMVMEWIKLQRRVWSIPYISCVNRVCQGWIAG